MIKKLLRKLGFVTKCELQEEVGIAAIQMLKFLADRGDVPERYTSFHETDELVLRLQRVIANVSREGMRREIEMHKTNRNTINDIVDHKCDMRINSEKFIDDVVGRINRKQI